MMASEARRSKRSHRRLAVALVALFVLGLGVSACGTSDSGGESGDSEQLDLGYTATLTGSFASYGTEMLDGAKLAIKQINAAGGVDGKEISLRSEDDQGKPSNGPIVAQKFCDESDTDAVLGYSFSSVALAAAPIYEQCEVPVLASAVTSPELSGISPFFFRNALNDAYQGQQMGEYTVKQLDLKRIAVLNSNDDYGTGTSEGFIKGVKESGGTILSRDEYELGETSFESNLTKVKGEDPEAIYIGGFYAEASKIATQARGLGLEQQLLGSDGSLSPDLIKLGGEAVEGMILYGVFSPTVKSAKIQKFVQAYEKAYGEQPSSWAALAYDAVYTIKAAAEKSGETSRAGIQKGLQEVSYDGVTGPAKFDSDGDRQGKIVFLEVKNGQFELAPKQ